MEWIKIDPSEKGSKVFQRILANTPKEVDEFVDRYAEQRIFLSIAKTDFQCPHCRRKYSDADDKFDEQLLGLSNVVGQSEQLHECSHRKGKECIKPSSCSAFGCNKPM